MHSDQPSNPKSDQILARLQALHPKSIDLTLERIERLLSALGNPERELAPVVHIAGTNGKGSTTAFLRAILEAAGLRVHVYTSPHLVRFNERIRVAGQIIEDDELQDVLEACERANAGEPITYFEITTAAAFVAFSRVSADIVLLETGLGGRLDATNVIAHPRLTAITPISMDHQHFLGDDIESIATEKAGILKHGVPALSAAQASRKVERVLKKAAESLSAPLLREGKDWFMRFKGKDLSYLEGEYELALPKPALSGRHQVQNAGLAIACARALSPDFDIPDAALVMGLKAVTWPARLQHLKNGLLVEQLTPGWELWLDGGHNRAAAEALSRHLRTWRDKPLWLVFGSLNQRDPLAFLKPFEARVVGLRCVAVPGEQNSLDPALAVAAGEKLNMAAKVSPGVAEAVADILKSADSEPGRILVCGSLYLAGDVLAENEKNTR